MPTASNVLRVCTCLGVSFLGVPGSAVIPLDGSMAYHYDKVPTFTHSSPLKTIHPQLPFLQYYLAIAARDFSMEEEHTLDSLTSRGEYIWRSGVAPSIKDAAVASASAALYDLSSQAGDRAQCPAEKLEILGKRRVPGAIRLSGRRAQENVV